MSKSLKDILVLSFITVLLTLAIWLPFILKIPSFYGLNFEHGFPLIYRNFDGLNYIVIAKTFYNPNVLAAIPQSLPANYFPAHFPGYPLFIFLFAPVLGYLKAMLFVPVVFTIASTLMFYFLLRDYKLTSHPLWLSILFLVLPARWVVVHSVGSPEPMFIFFTISSMYFFKKYENIGHLKFLWGTAIFASLAQLTKPPGILLFIAFSIYLLIKQMQAKNFKDVLFLPLRFLPLILIPLTLLGIFSLYMIQTGDFLAYFHSGDNIHLTFPPYQMFNKYQIWVRDIWLEDIIYLFILGFLGGILLLKQKLQLFGIFVLTFLAATIFVSHRDIARYSLPIIPFLIIAFEKILVTKEFKIVMAIVLLAIYLYSQNFLIENVAPIGDLTPYN